MVEGYWSKLRYNSKEHSITGSFLCIGHVPEDTSRPDDILKCIKPLITPHYFRHNHVTMLYEADIDPLIAMKIVGHTDYQTTANTSTPVSRRRC